MAKYSTAEGVCVLSRLVESEAKSQLTLENLQQRVTHHKADPGHCSGGSRLNLEVKGRGRRTLRDQTLNSKERCEQVID